MTGTAFLSSDDVFKPPILRLKTMTVELEISKVYQHNQQTFTALQRQLPPSPHWQLEQLKLQKEFATIEEAIAIYHRYFESFYESRDRFSIGYQLGWHCSNFLQDAAYFPVEAIRTALKLELNQAALSPYFLGIQIGWKLSHLQQKLERFFKQSETRKTQKPIGSLSVVRL